jgi:NitT/TauT family transport system substrate-binding protein
MSNSPNRFRAPRGRWLARAALTVAVAATLAVTACSSSSKSPASGGGSGTGGAGSSSSGSLQTIRFGLSSATVTAFSANYAIGDYLGCYKKYGFKVSVQGYPSPAALLVAFQHGSVDVGVPGSDQFTSWVKTAGSSMPMKAFFELDYPFRYGLAVPANSSITSFSQLAGKSVGIASQSDSSNATLQAVLKGDNLSPTSIKTIATGTGAASAQALRSGKVAGLWFNDTGIGSVIQDGVNVKFLTTSNGQKPFLNAGGILAVTTAKEYAANTKMFQAVATCSTFGGAFAAANPSAASYILLQMFPKLGLVGQSLDKQIANIAFGLSLRAPLFHSTDASVPYGQMNAQEFSNNQTILLGINPPTVDTSSAWTNDLIATANSQADVAGAQTQAKNYKIPGLSGPVTLPTIPPNAP